MRGKGWALAATIAVIVTGCDSTRLDQTNAALEVDPVPDFGHVVLGRQVSYQLNIKNVGRANVVIEDIAQAQPTLRDFAVGDIPKKVLKSGQSMKVPISFAPTALGQRAALLNVDSSAGQRHVSLDLTGIGVLGKAGYGPRVLDFGDVGLTSTRTLPIVFANTESDPAAVSVGTIGGANPEGFKATPAGNLSVEALSAMTVEVTFHPWRLGKFTATIPVQPCPTCAVEQVEMMGNGITSCLTVAPNPLDFGTTTPGTALMQSVTIGNLCSQPVKLSAAALGGQSSPDFSLPAPQFTGAMLNQNGTATIAVAYDPKGMGPSTGELRVPTDDDGTPVVIVPLAGSGVGPAILVTPDAVAFPRTAIGLQVQKSVDVRNVGVDPAGVHPLIVNNITITGSTAFTVTPPAPFTLAAGRGQYLTITYAPTTDGMDTATMTIASNDAMRPTVTVPLSGSAEKLGDCSYQVVPPALNFASVATGSRAQLSFAVRNVGTNDCAIANIKLAAGSSPEFAVDNISTRLIMAGGQLLIPVEFQPTGPGDVTGAVTFDVNSMAAPMGQVPLNGSGVPACFQVVPQALDFGTVGLMCKAPTLSVALENKCSVAVGVNRSYIGPSPSNAFTVNPAQAGAQTIQPGGQSIVSVTYGPTMVGTDNAPMYVDTSLQPNPYLVELDGNAVAQLTQTDTFMIPPVQKVDVLWVVDNSGSMADKQANLAANAARFIREAVANGVDFHIAVTTTGLTPYTAGWTQCPGGAQGGEDGRFFPVDNSIPRILTPQTPNVQQAFAQLAQVGTCHWIETGLEAARLALTAPLVNNADDPNTPEPNDGNAGFVRPDARLYVVYVTDEDDIVKDPNGNDKIPNPVPVQTYVDQLRSMKPGRPDMVGASAIIGLPGSCNGNIDGVGYRYEQLVQQFGGQIADVCSANWGNVIDTIATAAFQPQLAFPLSQQPGNRNVTVTVNGVNVPATDANGKQEWHYDPTLGTYGEVVFSPAYAPGPNATVTISYALPCPP